MPEPTILYPGFVGDPNMNPGVPMVGSQMAPVAVYPSLPGVAFSSQGLGKFAVDKLTGRQGALDMWLTTGAIGSARSLVVLSNGVTYVEILLDATNKISLIHKAETGVTIAALTSQYAAEGSGVRMRLRYTWDSTRAIDGSRFALFRKNEEAAVTWATDPTVGWNGFFPTFVYLGVGGIGTGTSFNGSIEKVQIGSQVVLT